MEKNNKEKKINDIWVAVILFIVGIFAIIFVINRIINFPYNDELEEGLYKEPTFYSKKEVEEYIQNKYGDDWKIIGEPQVINYTIGAPSKEDLYGTVTNKEDAIAYKYKFYRKNNNDYMYAYSTSQHEQKRHWSGGFSTYTDKYEKVILTNYFSDLIESHKQEINKLAMDYGINCSINEKSRKIVLDPINDIYINVNNSYELSKVAQLIEKINNVLKINTSIDEFYTITINYNYLSQKKVYIDLSTYNTYNSIYEKLKEADKVN